MMTEAMEECGCTEEYGPCEQHCEVLVQREGAALRTADELALQYLADAVDLVPDALSPYGQHVLKAGLRDLAQHRSGWLSQHGGVTSDELYSVVDQVETELGVAEMHTYREDGYRIVRITGGPFAELDS